MSTYDPYRPARRAGPSAWPFVALLVFVAALLGGLVYLLWPARHGALDPNAQPRAVTPAGDLAADEKATIALFKTVSPSVVHVTNLTERRDSFSLNVQEVPRGSGTGIVWDENGWVVTNYHVVQGASVARVILADQTSYDSREIWGYPDKDLAVIRIRAPKEKMKAIAVGTSHDLQVGQKTFAIGNPFGLDQSLTTGVVSALGREIESVTGRPIRGVIQTSAPINPGNSGGPLLDSSGRLIGVNAAIRAEAQGIGFAIPVDEVNRVVPQLIAHGKVVRPRLGVQLAEDQQAQRLGVEDGALVIQVVPKSPAQKAGLRGTRLDERREVALGDVIVGIDDKKIHSGNDLFAALDQYKAGDAVTVAFLRDGDKKEARATLEVVE